MSDLRLDHDYQDVKEHANDNMGDVKQRNKDIQPLTENALDDVWDMVYGPEASEQIKEQFREFMNKNFFSPALEGGKAAKHLPEELQAIAHDCMIIAADKHMEAE